MGNDIRNRDMWEEIQRCRNFMKCTFSDNDPPSDQDKKLPQPPLGNAAKGEVIELPMGIEAAIVHPSYAELLDIRRSERVFGKEAMTREQLAFILWSIQGVQFIRGANYATMRPAPSGGARHPFEIYAAIRDVAGMKPGVYHYLPLEHIGEKKVALEFHRELPDYEVNITDMLSGQKWAATAQAVIFFSCVAYRGEWRYSKFAHRVMLIDLGHAGQNLMLSAAATGLGSCCIAAYDQDVCDKTLGLDGFEEYTVYACAVGCVKR